MRPRIRVGFSNVLDWALGGGGAVDLLGLEAVVCMAVAADCNQLPNSTPACLVALAIEHEVDSFRCLGPHESVIEVGPCTQGKVGETIQRIPRRFRMDRRQRSPPWPVFMACSKSYPHSLRISPMMIRSGRWRSAAAKSSLGVMAT